jgi:hypothetical protein
MHLIEIDDLSIFITEFDFYEPIGGELQFVANLIKVGRYIFVVKDNNSLHIEGTRIVQFFFGE